MKDFVIENLQGLTIFLTIVITAIPIYFKLADSHDEKEKKINQLSQPNVIKKILVIWPYPTLAGIIFVLLMFFAGWVFLLRDKDAVTQSEKQQNMYMLQLQVQQEKYTVDLKETTQGIIDALKNNNIEIRQRNDSLFEVIEELTPKKIPVLEGSYDPVTITKTEQGYNIKIMLLNSMPDIPITLHMVRGYLLLNKNGNIYANGVDNKIQYIVYQDTSTITQGIEFTANFVGIANQTVDLSTDTLFLHLEGTYDKRKLHKTWYWNNSMQTWYGVPSPVKKKQVLNFIKEHGGVFVK